MAAAGTVSSKPDRLGAAARRPLARAAEPGLPAEPVPAVADAARPGRSRRPLRPPSVRIGLLGNGCRVLARARRARPRPAREPAVALERDARVEHERQRRALRAERCPAATRSRSPPASTRPEVRNDRPDQRAARPPARDRRAARSSSWPAGSCSSRPSGRRPRHSTLRSATRASSSRRRRRSCAARRRTRASRSSAACASRSPTTWRCPRSSGSSRGRPA